MYIFLLSLLSSFSAYLAVIRSQWFACCGSLAVDSLAVIRLLLILLQLVKTPAVLTTGVLIFPYIFIIITIIFMLVLLELPCCLT